jgi:endo-1,3(4)-beta-glucanase
MPRSPLPNDGDSASNNHPWGDLIRTAINANSDNLDNALAQIDAIWNKLNQISNAPVTAPPVAYFSADRSSGTVPVTVNFTDTSTNNPTSWSWSFGDGSTSNLQNPSHTYTVAGTYTVKLVVTNNAGSSVNTQTPGSDGMVITANASVNTTIPNVNFVANPVTGNAPLSVFFTDTSTGGPTSWSWNFGDNTSLSTQQNPAHTYATAGTYTVALTARNAAGAATVTKTSLITVSSVPVDPPPSSDNPRAPIATSAPNYPTAQNSNPVNTNLTTLKTTSTTPIPTNAWFENFIVESGRQAINIFPYEVQSTVKGLDICVPTLNTNFPASVLATMLQNFSFQSVETITSTKVTSFTDLSCTLTFNTGSSAYMAADIVRGMAYVTMKYVGLRPVLYTQNAIIRVNGTTAQPTGTFSTSPVGSTGMHKLKCELNSGQTWIIYTTSAMTFNLTGSSTLTASAAFNGSIRMAYLPAATVETTLDTNAAMIPTGGSVALSVAGNTATEVFNFTTTGSSGTLLMYALPHHQGRLSSPVYPADATIKTLRGNMRMVAANSWTLLLALPPVSWNNRNTINAGRLTSVKNALTADKAFVPHYNDPYFGAKQGAKAARLALIADQVGDTAARDQLVTQLRTWLNNFFADQQPTKLRYDTVWGGLVSQVGLTNKDADFGNGRYNDHHFHYGYTIYAAAVLAKFDTTWGGNATNKAKINDLVRDIANPSTSDTYFTPMRHWDWFEGHSWAAGTFEFGDNRNSESTSEGVNAYYGMYLWGLITGQNNITSLGRILFAEEVASAQTYWQIKQADTMYPSPFKKNGVIGIVWSNKVDYATWFGAQDEYIHGIQMLPITPASEVLIRPDWISETWPNNLLPLWTRSSVWRAEIVSAGNGYVPAQYSTTGQGFTNGLVATGGSGNGLVFNVNITSGGAMDSVYIVFNQRGTGYQNGDIVTLNGSGGSGCTVRVYTQPEDGWKGVLLGGYSHINADDAWSRAQALTSWDDGSSKTQTLYHIATQTASGGGGGGTFALSAFDSSQYDQSNYSV